MRAATKLAENRQISSVSDLFHVGFYHLNGADFGIVLHR